MQPTHLFLATSKWISKLLEQLGKPLMDRQQSEGSGHLRTDSKVLTAHSQRPLPRKIRLGQTPAQREQKAHARRRRRRRQTQSQQQETPTNMCYSSVWTVFLRGIFLEHICGFLFTEHVFAFSFCAGHSLGNLLKPHFWLFIIFSPLCPLDIVPTRVKFWVMPIAMCKIPFYLVAKA